LNSCTQKQQKAEREKNLIPHPNLFVWVEVAGALSLSSLSHKNIILWTRRTKRRRLISHRLFLLSYNITEAQHSAVSALGPGEKLSRVGEICKRCGGKV